MSLWSYLFCLMMAIMLAGGLMCLLALMAIIQMGEFIFTTISMGVLSGHG